MARKPEPPAEPEQDQHAGLGGAYTVDPKTGRRTLVERTGLTAPVPAPAPAPNTESQD